MVRVAIILPQGCSLSSSVIRLYEMFDFVNSLLTKQQEDMMFSVDMVGTTSLVNLYGDLRPIKPSYTIYDYPHENNVVIIPTLAGHIAESIKNNQAFIPWLLNKYYSGAEIAGLCTGAFFLSDTYLVNKTDCTRKWYVSAGFRKEFLQINKLAENLILEEMNIFTDSGAYTFIKKLLESTVNKGIAEACASMFELEFNRECQSVFSIVQQEINIERFAEKNIPISSSSFIPNDSSFFNERYYCMPDNHSEHSHNCEAAEIPGNTMLFLQQKNMNAVTFKKIFRKANVK